LRDTGLSAQENSDKYESRYSQRSRSFFLDESIAPPYPPCCVRIARYRRSVAEYEEPQETLAIVSPRNFIAHRIDLMPSLPEKLFPSREHELQQASLDRDERTD